MFPGQKPHQTLDALGFDLTIKFHKKSNKKNEDDKNKDDGDEGDKDNKTNFV